MGLALSDLIGQWLGANKKARIICIGLDCAGKVCGCCFVIIAFSKSLDNSVVSDQAQ
jgi:hypothetical protein